MVREELYNKTVDILYQAYFKDELQRANCGACAVTNIIAGNLGIALKPREWQTLITIHDNYVPILYPAHRVDFVCSWFTSEFQGPHMPALERISGYNAGELMRIEEAFESAEIGRSDEEAMYNSLSAVISFLDQIHEVNTEVSQISKSRFSRHYETLTA